MYSGLQAAWTVPKLVALAANHYFLVRAAAQPALQDWAGLVVVLVSTVSHLRV